MKFRNHIFAIAVHAGILVATFILVSATSCKQEPPPPEPDPVGGLFDNMQDSLETIQAETIAVIAVDDNVSAGEDLRRQVLQDIQTQLHELKSIQILEFPRTTLTQKFQELNINPVDGISPEAAKQLAAGLQASALLYASIESSAPDVHIKVYSGETGAVIFAETLQAWPLPVTPENDDMFGLMNPEGNAETQPE